MRTKRLLFWILFVLSAGLVVGVTGLYLFVRALGGAPARVTSGSTLTLVMAGDLPEDTLTDFGDSVFGIHRLTLKDVLDSIARSKKDARVHSLVLRLRGSELGWARAEEIRTALFDFKTSGKHVAAYFEGGDNLDYFLATAADAIYVHPQGSLDVHGLAAEVTFMKGTLDKLGIAAEFEQIGRYKNAPDTFTRDSMSGPHREAIEAIVDDLYRLLVESIAASRKLDPAKVEAILDQGPFTPAEAKEVGLVDDALYEDEVENRIVGKDEEFKGITVADYLAAEPLGLSLGVRPKIALIYGEGAIVGGESDEDPLFGRVMGSDTLAKAFKDVRKDDAVRAVVFRINSPGGSDVASDIIWREAALTMEEKPVVVSMSDVAASGGYWIATASDAIVAERTTLTGSIGIFAGKFSLEKLHEKLGIKVETVRRGAHGDIWTSSRRFTEEERAQLREILEAGYDRFLEKVADSRDKEIEEVDALGQGRVWTGAQALEHGLVDALGGLDRAIALAKEKAEIAADRAVDVEVYPAKRGLLELLARQISGSARTPQALQILSPEALVERSPFLKLLLRERRFALMPFRIRVR